jgi:hypothetical protein
MSAVLANLETSADLRPLSDQEIEAVVGGFLFAHASWFNFNLYEAFNTRVSLLDKVALNPQPLPPGPPDPEFLR